MEDIKKYLGGSPRTLNEINMSVVLDRIRRGDNVSRSSLAKELKLSLPSISRIVGTLINKKYVIEAGLGKSSGGKKPTIIRFNEERAYVIGIGVDVNFIDIMLSDISGNEKRNIYKKFLRDKSPKDMIKTIVKYIDEIIKDAEVEDDKVEVVSLGIPAMVESETGLVRMCPTIPSWEGINLGEVLSGEINKDVLVDNEANMSLLGERWRGEAQNINNAIFIGVGTGVGAGILINGKIFRGHNGSAGEIGNMFIDRNLNKRNSQPYGQFEYLASNKALREKVMGVDSNSEVKQTIKKLAKNDDIKKDSILEIVDNFAFGVANLITVLNPELVVIREDLFYESDYFFNYLKDKIYNLMSFKTRIVKSSLKERAVTIGAIRLAMKYLDRKILSPFFY